MRIVGHAGALGLAPSNTLSGITKAIEHGVDEVEIDVRVSKDNVPILCHWPRLADASGQKLRVTRHSYSELKKHKADLTTLAEALELLNAKVDVCIEIKHHTKVKPIVKVIKLALDHGWSINKMTVSSFSFKRLKEIKQRLPDINLAVNEQWSGLRAQHRARVLQTNRLNMQRRWLWRGYVGPLAKRGYEIYGYTINDTNLAQKMTKYGLFGIITDYPDRF